MKKLISAITILTVATFLYACSGGGGGGGVAAPATPAPPATTLTGTVTDTALQPVTGASVQILGTTSSTTTDAAGRYTFTALPANTAYTLKFSGPTVSYFPTFAKAALIENHPTALDVFLNRAGDLAPPKVDATAIVSAVSTASIDSGKVATLNLGANELLEATGAAYTGTATVYIAPIDVSKPGSGMANYQPTLGNVFSALTANSKIVEFYAAAAVTLTDASGNPLTLAPTATALTLPIPDAIAAPPTGPLSLWYLDETNGALTASGSATKDAGDTYTGNISRTGVWMVGVERTFNANEVTEVSGTIIFNDATPAMGATVHASGVDYAYHAQTTTDANGAFTVLAKNGGTVNVTAIAAANGAQWSGEANAVIAPNPASITIPHAQPTPGAVATATIMVDDLGISGGGNAPDVVGYALASGRQLSKPASITDDLAFNIGNFVFAANSLPGLDPVTVAPPSDNGSGILEITTGETFETLATTPTVGYHTAANSATFSVNLDPVTATFPILLAVKTDQGHYGKVVIDSVSALTTNEWQINIRHAFSLTGTF